MKSFLSYFDEDVLLRLRAVAASAGTTVAEVIRVCVKQALPLVEERVKQQLLVKSGAIDVPKN